MLIETRQRARKETSFQPVRSVSIELDGEMLALIRENEREYRIVSSCSTADDQKENEQMDLIPMVTMPNDETTVDESTLRSH